MDYRQHTTIATHKEKHALDFGVKKGWVPLPLGVCQIIVMTMHRDSNFHDLLHRLLTPRIDY
jgi:hypothetical protein